MLEIRKTKKFNSVGITLERQVRDQNFYINAKYANLELLPWVDFSAGMFAEVVRGNLILSGNLKTILSKNRNWFPVESSSTSLNLRGESAFSVYSNLKIAYLL
jgi:hypothetical protein